MAYFLPFSIKTFRAAQKNTSNMAAIIGNVIDDITCKSSIDYSGTWTKINRRF
jgi:hypothetical protein